MAAIAARMGAHLVFVPFFLKTGSCVCGRWCFTVLIIWNSSEEPTNDFAKVFFEEAVFAERHAAPGLQKLTGPSWRLQEDRSFELLEMTRFSARVTR